MCPLNSNKFLLSTIPFLARIVVLSVSEILEEKFFKLFPLSCKKIFLTSLFIFFSTKKSSF